jgi:hypothetical protein
MKRILILCVAAILCATIICGARVSTAYIDYSMSVADAQTQAQQTKQAHADAPALSDKAKLEIRDEQLAGTRMIAEFQNLQSTIEKAQKRQEELKLAFAASDKNLQSLTKDVCGDPKLWALDLDALQCKPAPQPSPTPKSN